jgi:rhodanese-related sulfurtransferase
MSGFASNAHRLTPAQARELASEGKIMLLDVREPKELAASGKAKGAVHVPLSLIAMKADPRSPDYDSRFRPTLPIAVYCAAGARAGSAAQVLTQLGYQAQNIGGFADWCACGGAVEA